MSRKNPNVPDLDVDDIAFCAVWATSKSIRQVAKRLQMPTFKAFNGAWYYKVILGVQLRELPVRRGLQPRAFSRGPIGCDHVGDPTGRLAG